jgi:flagellar basal-body rod protein FlgF
MPYGLYISAEGAQAQSRRLETIANNLATVDTAGFKRDLALLQARYAEETQRGTDYYGSGTINDLGGGVMVRHTKTDFAQGPLKPTGVETDMAIRGEGFFVVRKGGEMLLTRAGDFTLSPAGELVTTAGDPVLDEGNAPVLIDPTLGDWTLTAEGAVSQGGTQTPLALVKPQSPGDLAKVGEGLFRPLAPTRPVDPAERSVAAGYLEESTVKPTTEMMEMIEASRAFEANVSLIRNQDQMLGTLISRVLRSS